MIVTVVYHPDVQLTTIKNGGQRRVRFACKAENGQLAFYLEYPNRAVLDEFLKQDLESISAQRPARVSVVTKA